MIGHYCRQNGARKFGARLVRGAASLHSAGVFATGEPEVILVSPEELRNGEVVSVDIEIAPRKLIRCEVEVSGLAPIGAPEGSRTYWADIVKFGIGAERAWNDAFEGASSPMLAMAA